MIILLALFLSGSLQAAPPPVPKTRDSLVLCDDVSDPVTLDPHRAFENKSFNLIFQMFEGLVRHDRDGRIAPALAKECRFADPLTLRCVLRSGVRFHNGEPLDAEAVRWSLTRQLDPATGYPALMEISGIKEVRVPEPGVVEILTRAPDGLLLHRLAAFVKILPPRYYQEKGSEAFAQAPVGTGPFRFVSWEKGVSIELEANPDYWDAERPKLKRVSFRFLPEAQQLPKLLSGELDLVTEVPATRTLEVARNASTRIEKRLVLTTPAFWATSFDGPLKDPKVRRALNLAVDKRELIRYAVLGNGEPIATLSMRGETGRAEGLKPYAHDPAKARRLLAEAGVKPGTRLTILAAEQAAREAKILAEQWKRVGLEPELTVLPLSEVHKIMVERRREFDLSANLAPNPTAHMYFLPGVCFHSRSLFSRLKDPEFDAKYERVLGAVDPEEARRAGSELDRFIHDQALGVFTYQKIRTFGLKRGLEIPIPVTGILSLESGRWR